MNKRLKNLNFEPLVEMLGDVSAPYDTLKVIKSVKKLIKTILKEKTFSNEKKIKLCSELLFMTNKKIQRLIHIEDLKTVNLNFIRQLWLFLN